MEKDKLYLLGVWGLALVDSKDRILSDLSVKDGGYGIYIYMGFHVISRKK